MYCLDLVGGHTAKHGVGPQGPLAGFLLVFPELLRHAEVLYDIALFRNLALQLRGKVSCAGSQKNEDSDQMGKRSLDHSIYFVQLYEIHVYIVGIGDEKMDGTVDIKVLKYNFVEHISDGHPQVVVLCQL